MKWKLIEFHLLENGMLRIKESISFPDLLKIDIRYCGETKHVQFYKIKNEPKFYKTFQEVKRLILQ